MRLWTVHPRYLDAQGLVALWREGLLARAVLAGRTRGYTRHPQLERFAAQPAPVDTLDAYLAEVLAESLRRGYRFDARKIGQPAHVPARMAASTGQRDHEWQHLMAKLERRSPAQHAQWRGEAMPSLHPLFSLVEGPIADWERA